MSKEILSLEEIKEILTDTFPDARLMDDDLTLIRAVEDKVASRFRAQGGNTSDNITQAAAKIEEAKRKLSVALTSVDEVYRDSAIHQALAALNSIAANKAAEEGGLPGGLPLLPEPSFKSIRKGGLLIRDAWDALEMFEYARAAIAADRASRQVANKEEVEPTPFAHVRFRAGQRITTEGDVDANEWYEFCDPEEIGDDRIPAFPVYATPPATTGASTAQANGYLNVIENLESQLAECMKVTEKWASAAGEADGRAFKAEEEVLSLHRQLAAEKLRADQGWQRAEAKSRECIDLRERIAGSVGASTVLTDERIEKMWDKAFGSMDIPPAAYTFAREVAAQSGNYDDADVTDLEVRDALGDQYDPEAGEAVSVLRIMAAWKAEAELGEKYKQMALGAAQAGQIEVPSIWVDINSIEDTGLLYGTTRHLTITGSSEKFGDYTTPLYAAPSPAKESK